MNRRNQRRGSIPKTHNPYNDGPTFFYAPGRRNAPSTLHRKSMFAGGGLTPQMEGSPAPGRGSPVPAKARGQKRTWRTDAVMHSHKKCDSTVGIIMR